MLLRNKAVSKLRSVTNKLKDKRNILRNRTILSLIMVMASVVSVFLMMGVMYSRGEAFITDGDKTTRVFTMLEDPYEILAEQGIELMPLDRVEFSGFKEDNTADIVVRRAISVTVEDDGKAGEEPESVEAAVTDTVAEILDKSGIALGEYDKVQPKADTECTDGMAIKISRAFDVSLIADGETVTVKSQYENAKTLLERAGITLGDEDYLDVETSSVPKAGDVITVHRVKYTDRITVNSIPYETEEKYSNLLAIGTSEVTEGVNGAEKIVTREKYIDGKLVDTEEISSEITAEPVNEVITYGKALATPYSKRDFSEINLDGGLPTDYQYVVSGKACAYTAPAGAGSYSGRDLIIGTVAVDPDVIPFGSLLYIVSQDGSRVYGAAVAADTGSFTDVVTDLYMGTTAEHYSDACAWGARYVDIYVISVGTY